MDTETPPTLKIGDVVTYKGNIYKVYSNVDGFFFGTSSMRDALSGRVNQFWNPIHQALGVTPFNICLYPNYKTLEDLSKVLYHLTAQEAIPATTVKPKRAPRRKDGIPESTYRWRNRKTALDSITLERDNLKDLLHSAQETAGEMDHTIRDLHTRLRLAADNLSESKTFASQVAATIGLPNKVQEDILPILNSIMKDYLYLQDEVKNLKTQNQAQTEALVAARGACDALRDHRDGLKADLEQGLYEMTEDRDGLLGQLADVHLDNKILSEKNTQLLNENAQARRDAWSATYKLELLLAQPWRNLVTLLTKRKG